MFSHQLKYGFALAMWLGLAALAVFGALHHAISSSQLPLP
jgi:hypothetical protein